MREAGNHLVLINIHQFGGYIGAYTPAAYIGCIGCIAPFGTPEAGTKSPAANARTDGYAELHINAWDVAAGMVIASEAGGWVSDFFAGDGISKGNPILCCTPALASQLSDITGIA